MARLQGFEKLTDVDQALSAFFKALKAKRLSAECVPVEDAWGRVAAESIVAPVDLPPFDRSAVDGYALRAQDTFEASQFKSKKLRLTNEEMIGIGEAKQVWTGNPLSKNADAVVMLEHTKPVKDGIEVLTALTPGENVSKMGEDFHKGEKTIESGTRLRSHHIGLLASLGFTHVKVFKKPRVAILSTGNELVELGKKPQSNQIIDSNRFMIASLCEELGAEPINLGIAKDNLNEIGQKIFKGLDEADIVITTGGSSVGAPDLVPIVVDKLGKPGIVVHGVALRPGMPTALAVLRGKPVFVLSGYPVAATIGFEVFIRPTILKMFGIENEPRPVLKARLTKRVVAALGRRVYLRVYVYNKDGEFFAEPIKTKGSGLLSTITKGNGYVIVPENREGLEKDETVTVHLFGTIGSEPNV